ncbi:MAG TPA: hypothetical protein VK721_13235 [Solirubrobacteraceae bacterium]|jgi:hypothetical protein|nr:hypothetical protein [Solirubrobacteraceae bacterium]
MNATPHTDGLSFGPTASSKMYLAMYQHRGHDPSKSCWSPDVPPPMEYSIFERADDEQHSDPDGHYWGVRDAAGAALGTAGERLAKFPFNALETVPWHGYPVSPASGRPSETPPDSLIEGFIDAGVVSRTFGRKLQRRKA